MKDKFLESGFSGTITDRAGRKRKYIDGKPVKIEKPSHAGAAATTGAQAKKKAKSHVNSVNKAERQSFIDKLKSLASGAKELAKNAAARIGQAAWDRLTEKEKQVAESTWKVAKGLYTALESPRHHIETIAKESAKERGLNEKQVKQISSTLAVASVVEQWVTNIPATHHALHELHIEGAAGFVLAKVGAFIPVAAIGYIAYSTARNPFATLRAAKKVLGSQSHDLHESIMESMSEADIREYTDMLSDRAAKGDWYFALLSVALDQTKNLKQAIQLADEAFEKQPAEEIE